PAEVVDCSGHQYVDFDITMSRTGDAVAPALTVIPYYLDASGAAYTAGTATVLTFGGASGDYESLKQRIRVEARGNSVALLVESIAGTGASVDIGATLS
ncbi:MAG: hypothetical protein NUW22_14220, partial [Acidobacteria bacterium]|nr:hypothetical protein [Acidobacteriota bacterium]